MAGEDLFNVPIDKQDKNTADGLSLELSNQENGNANTGEIAAKALDFPITTSHSP